MSWDDLGAMGIEYASTLLQTTIPRTIDGIGCDGLAAAVFS